MKKFTLSLIALLAVSWTGLAAQTLEQAKQDAKTYLQTCISSVPYGHNALELGLSKVEAATSVDAVATAKAEAAEASLKEMRDDIYRIRVTVKNQGLADAKKGAFMHTPGNTLTTDEMKRTVSFERSVYHQGIWIFNYRSAGRYTLCSNDRFYLGTEWNSSDTTLVGSTFVDTARDFSPEFSADGHLLLPYFEKFQKMTDTGAVETIEQKRYLVATEKGKLDYVLNPEDEYAEWTIARAYDDSVMDGPYLTFDTKNPVLYAVKNANGHGYLTVAKLNDWADAKEAQSEYSFWYFVDRGSGDGCFYVQNVNGERLLYNIVGYRCFTSASTTDKPFYPFVMEGYEKGLAMTVEVAPQYNAAVNNPHCLGWTTTYEYRCAQLSQPNLTDPNNFAWLFEQISGTDAEAFTDAKQKARENLRKYLALSDFGQSVINDAMTQINERKQSDFANIAEVESWLSEFTTTTLTRFAEAVNKEIAGSQLTLRNVRRAERGQAAMLAMLEANANTQTAFDHASVWNAESAGNGYVRFSTIDGKYLGAATNGQPVAVVSTADQAGLYKFALCGDTGFSVISSTNGNVGLNIDTNGNAAVGYSATDGGSVWTLLATAAIPQLEGGPKVSTSENRIFYMIRNKAYRQVINGFGQNYYCRLGDMTVNAYWYLTSAGNGDGVMLNVDESSCAMIMSSGYAITTQAGGQPFYITPRGETAAEGYYITCGWPADGNYLTPVQSTYNLQLTYGPLTTANADNLTWFFEEYTAIDYQGIFDQQAAPQIEQLEAYREVQPWGHDIIDEAIARLRGSWDSFGDGVENAISQMREYVGNTLIDVEEEIEMTADKAAVNITSIRRRDNNFASGAHLAVVDGKAVTVTDPMQAAWRLEYASNGRFRIRTANTFEYLGVLPSESSKEVEVVADKAQAGLYSLVLRNRAVSLINRSAPEWGLNIDMNGSPAVSYSTDDAGSRWHISMADPASIASVATDLDSAENEEYYDLQGRRVVTPAAPGLYISKGKKIIVK